ncbi:MAG: class I SAM-dependent methyltransferase, partial [Lachnospiraceae bacterium]|nr:class I SAM-dependent methyltransferase [Lachnospiraceae bacterium]
MSTREEIVTDFYGKYDEETRLERSRKGQLEYFTTMEYIHRYAGKGTKVLEVGAGTGRYSVALAKEGMDVTAVELTKSNLDILRRNAEGLTNLTSYQGDALRLDMLADDEFDVTL